MFFSNSEKVKEYAKRFSQGHWTFLGPGDEKKWCGTLPYTPEGNWESTATRMLGRFTDTAHPIFKSICALSRGILKKNGRDRHFNADASNTELLFRIIHSVNQLSTCGAVSNWCEQFGWTRKTERIRDQTCIDKCETTRSKTIGIFSKTSIWKQFAGKHSGLRITVRNNSIHKVLRTCIVPAEGISWDEIDDGFWQIIPLCIEYTSSKINSRSRAFCGNSWRNNYWTSP